MVTKQYEEKSVKRNKEGGVCPFTCLVISLLLLIVSFKIIRKQLKYNLYF